MENLTRRKFFQGMGTLAAGIALCKGIREHGPVDIRLFFFSLDPRVIKGELLSSEREDLFRVSVYHEKQIALTAEMKLSDIQKIVSMPRKKIRLEVTFRGNGHVQKEHMRGISRNGTLAFLFKEKLGQEDSPIWLMLEDVKRVL